MTNLEKFKKENPNLTDEEVIKNNCPNEPFIDENMIICENCSGVTNSWCKRHWMCEDDE